MRWFSVTQLVAGLRMLGYMMVAARLLGREGEVATFGLFQAVMGLNSIVFVLGFPLNVVTIHVVGVALQENRPAALGSCLMLACTLGNVCCRINGCLAVAHISQAHTQWPLFPKAVPNETIMAPLLPGSCSLEIDC